MWESEGTSATNVAAAVGGKRGVVAVYAPPEEPRREPADPEALFRAGLHLLERNHRPREAALALERAYQSKPSDPRYVSYYGLSLALSTNRLRDAEVLCARAVTLEFCRPELFHNLGRVRLLLGDRRGAHAAFEKGLSVDRNDTRIQQEIARLGIRKAPPIGFLSRRHPLNKYIGLLCYRLGKRRSR
ncbi:MAG: tetratricopeptide repeat protein [bacterium]